MPCAYHSPTNHGPGGRGAVDPDEVVVGPSARRSVEEQAAPMAIKIAGIASSLGRITRV
jgi:hypothetical protein